MNNMQAHAFIAVEGWIGEDSFHPLIIHVYDSMDNLFRKGFKKFTSTK